MLDTYMRDPMEGGEPPSEQPSATSSRACARIPRYVFLTYRDSVPVGLSICFLGFSTFLARPLLNIHDIFVDLSVRGRGIGAMLLKCIKSRRAI